MKKVVLINNFMKRYSFFWVITCVFLISCKFNSTSNNGSLDHPDSAKQIKKIVNVDTSGTYEITSQDTLLNLSREDTTDCGGIINALFHRSSYKFPVEGDYKKDELTAIIESVHDSLLLVKIVLVDSVADDRITVDWLKLNCKTKRLEHMPLYGPDPKPTPVKYDLMLLTILMRKCAVE